MMAGLNRKEITKGMVVVIRYEGPKGGPGMPEMLTPTSAIMGAGNSEFPSLLALIAMSLPRTPTHSPPFDPLQCSPTTHPYY